MTDCDRYDECGREATAGGTSSTFALCDEHMLQRIEYGLAVNAGQTKRAIVKAAEKSDFSEAFFRSLLDMYDDKGDIPVTESDDLRGWDILMLWFTRVREADNMLDRLYQSKGVMA